MEPSGPAASSVARPAGPMSFVARVGQQAAGGLAAEIERLKAERSAGMVILRLDPESIGLDRVCESTRAQSLDRRRDISRLQGEHPHSWTGHAGAGSTGGGRRAKLEYELVEGHRRHAAILQLNKEVEGGFPILARLDAKAADAKDLVLKMYRENAERRGPLSLSRWAGCLRSGFEHGLYKIAAGNQRGDPFARNAPSANTSPSPSCQPRLIAAFRDPRTIALRWSKELAKACRDRLKVVLSASR